MEWQYKLAWAADKLAVLQDRDWVVIRAMDMTRSYWIFPVTGQLAVQKTRLCRISPLYRAKFVAFCGRLFDCAAADVKTGDQIIPPPIHKRKAQMHMTIRQKYMPLLREEIRPNRAPTPAMGKISQLVQPRSGTSPTKANMRAMPPMSIEIRLAITVL